MSTVNWPRFMLVGLGLIGLQYLVYSVQNLSILLPELGLIVLVIMARFISWQELLAVGLIFGYVSDILGAAESGSLLAAYTVSAATLAGLPRVITLRPLGTTLLNLAAGLIVFHSMVAIVGAPVVARQWAGVVAVQLVSGLLLVAAHAWAQHAWRPSR